MKSGPKQDTLEILLPYTHIQGIPLCPCKDPGNYAALECHRPASEPLTCVLRCWCGSTMKVLFDDLDERKQFVINKGVAK